MPDTFGKHVTRLFALAVSLWAMPLAIAVDKDAANSDSDSPSLAELRVLGAGQSKYLRPAGGDSAEESDAESDPKKSGPDLDSFREVVQPILRQACLDCHGPDAQEADVRIDTLDPDLVHGDDVDWWLEVLGVLTNGEMPPGGSDDLSDDDRSQVVTWLSGQVQMASTVRRASGGHSSFRRLTRYEYNHAMQDMLGLDWDFARDLPPEARSEDGFENSSEMLHMSVRQLETYRDLALQALRRATVGDQRPATIRWSVSMAEAFERQRAQQADQMESAEKRFKDDPEKLAKEIERIRVNHDAGPQQARYRQKSSGQEFRAEWAYNGARYAFPPATDDAPFPETFDHVAVLPARRNQYLTIELGDQIPDEGIMRVRVRASKVSSDPAHQPSLRLEFGFQASNEGKAEVRVSRQDTPIDAPEGEPKIYQWDVPLGEIYPRNSFRRLSKMGALPSPSEYIRLVNTSVPQGNHGDIQIDHVEVLTPVFDQWPPPSHKRIFIASDDPDDENQYARQILTPFMSRAWRREVTQAEIDQKIKLFQAVRPSYDDFEQAMVDVLATVLSSPHFLYVSAAAPRAEDPTPSRLSDHELATRLSLFLWCSIPDGELLRLADEGRLSDADVLAGQVDRMLADPRSDRLASRFVHQWLDMQLLDFLDIAKQADSELKEAMQKEPIALFSEMLRGDDSVLNFIHADYTMVNERLALHYGLPDVRGNHFRRVSLGGDPKRGGLLTQAGLLAMNSDGTDSHPLKRGVWLLNSLLNDPPPPPPPAVPEIDLADPAIAKMTLKERIEDHRNHAACLSCHAKIDPWGIAFENYDALGRWRDSVDGKPVDASSRLFNDQPLDGMDGLKRFLLTNRQDQFVRAMVFKLASFGLGRPLGFSDYSSIDAITADVRQQGDGLATMVKQLVASEMFQSR